VVGTSDAGALIARLAARLPPAGPVTVVHGDFRIDNVILDPDDPGRVLAVLDWELATIGDPVADVAVTCAYRHPALDAVLGTTAAWTSPRLPDAAALAARYTALSGRALDHWEFHLALAYFKLAAIAAGIAHRHHAAGRPGHEPAADSVPVYLAAAAEALR
jgi:aminoglycoside phosphotransferase (APT) family kinase protein